MAAFLTTRALCLHASGDREGAARAAAAAYRIAPTMPGTAQCLMTTLTREAPEIALPMPYHRDAVPRIVHPGVPLPPDPVPGLPVPMPVVPSPAAPRPIQPFPSTTTNPPPITR